MKKCVITFLRCSRKRVNECQIHASSKTYNLWTRLIRQAIVLFSKIGDGKRLSKRLFGKWIEWYFLKSLSEDLVRDFFLLSEG